MAIAFARGQNEAADTGDAGQRFTAKTHRGDGGQVFSFLNFAGRMTFEREQRVVAAHAETVVGDAHEAASAAADLDDDFPGVGIEGIFDELFHDAGGSFDHFAGGDLVGDLLGKKFDAVHAVAWIVESLNRGIVKTVCRQSASDATIHGSRNSDYFARGKAKEKIAPRPASL